MAGIPADARRAKIKSQRFARIYAIVARLRLAYDCILGYDPPVQSRWPMMNDFIDQLAISANLERSGARRVTQSFLRMAKRHLSEPLAADLFRALPGACCLINDDTTASLPSELASGIEAMMSAAMRNVFGYEDPIIAVLNDAKAAGLTSRQALLAGQAFLDFARQKAGSAVVDRITDEIPGLGRLN